ncbi:MAG: ABC transporter permease [Actinobacteria bacterium]|nr:ABC transporter permease [Actinomycetota bacterium]
MSVALRERRSLRWGRISTVLADSVDSGAAVWVVVMIVAAGTAVGSGIFLTNLNISNLFGQMLLLGFAAVGETFAVLAGAIDLSVGSMAKLAALLTPGLVNGNGAMVVPVVALMLLVGVMVGLVNGLLITRLHVNAFIVTLGTFSILRGLAFGYSSEPVGEIPASIVNSMYLGVGPVPAPFIIFILLALTAAFALRKTVFGRRVYAVGGDEEVARMAGINTDRIVLAAMVISATFAALAGVMQGLRTGVGSPTAGDGLELSAITAVVLGGSSLFGGRGRLVGTIGGVFLLALVDNALNLIGVSTFYQDLVRGVVIVIAVAVFIRKD